VLASRPPSSSPPTHNPHSTRCQPAPNCPRLRALALFGRRFAEHAEGLVIAGVQKPAQLQKLPISLDHFVGEREYFVGDRETERLRGLEVDDKLKLGRLKHRHLGRVLALQDAARIDAGLAKRIRYRATRDSR
jgi:hypothetical protein